MAKYKVLSTKKLEPSLIDKARENDIEIIEQEFISIQPINTDTKHEEVMKWVRSGEGSYVVFTSANAVEVINTYLFQGAINIIPSWNIFCLRGRTKGLLKATFPEKRIIATAENAQQLAERIKDNKISEVTFFCGETRRDDLPDVLNNAGIKVHEVVLYRTTANPVKIENEIDGILFFSPSSVESFFSVNKLKENTVCFSIGKTTAASIKQHTSNKIVVSELPAQADVLKKVFNYFMNVV